MGQSGETVQETYRFRFSSRVTVDYKRDDPETDEGVMEM